MTYFSNITSSQLMAGIAGVGLVGIGVNRYCQGGHVSKENLGKDLSHEYIIVTGANTGIGYETTKQLAKQGAHVIMACRSEKRATEALNKLINEEPTVKSNVEFQLLDLGCQKSIKLFAERIKNRGIKIYALINNAGIMHCPHGTTKDGFEIQMGTNHLGHMALTLALLDELVESNARIVNVASLAHTMGTGKIRYNFEGPTRELKVEELYAQSKLANILFTKALARKIKRKYPKYKGSVTALHPGVIRTELTRHYNIITQGLLKIVAMVCFKSPWAGAQTNLHCALDDHIKTGGYYADAAPSKCLPICDDTLVQEKFYQASLKALTLKDPFES